MIKMVQQIERTFKVDARALAHDLAAELTDDGVDLDDSAAVAKAAWEQGVREPYFELEIEVEIDQTFQVGE